MPPRVFSLVKEYRGASELLKYDILEVSPDHTKLLNDAKRLQLECLQQGDPYFDIALENGSRHKDDHLTCWEAHYAFYCGYSKTPAPSICYRVIDKSVIVV